MNTYRFAELPSNASVSAFVTFAVSGGATVAATTDTTDASGIATAGAWQLGNTPATSTVTATALSGPP